jgi:transitional endoplasmic reticulum ATPase
MQFPTIQKRFPARKSSLVVEGSRAWIPLQQKLTRGRAPARTTVQAEPTTPRVATPAAVVVPQSAAVPTPSSAVAVPARAAPIPDATVPRPTASPVKAEAASHDCSDLIRPPRRTFQHIAGMEDTRRRLLRAGQEILAGEEARNGILLFGEPGNGKTLLAEALAGELGVPFLSVAFGDMASKWINETPEKLRGLFRTARRCAPCVLFIDEVDSFLKPRDGSGMSHSMDRDTVNTLLREIVELRREKVVLVAATNYIEQLDRAAVRSGRFDFHIEVPAPDYVARCNLIGWHIVRCLGKGAIDPPVVRELARRWEGFSAARLAALGPQLRDMQRDDAFDGPVTFELAMRAMRMIQGQCSAFPSRVVPLEDLVMPRVSRAMLTRLADQLGNVYDFTFLGGTLPRGILFYGPPGTGKTMAAMSLAKASGWLFLPTTGTDLISRPDEWEKLVRKARDQRPAIVFIDEADPVLANRRHSNVAALTNRILATIDGVGGRTPDVLYIAATNHPDVLDSAVLRGGRLAMQVRFDVPAEAEMLTWAQSALADRQTQLDFALECGAEELVVQLMTGRPVADAEVLIDEAINLSVMRFLRGEEEDRRRTYLRLEDLSAAAWTLGIDADE